MDVYCCDPLTSPLLPPIVVGPRDLSENKIAEVPPVAVTGLHSLTRIDLHTNEIERLPPELFRLTNISQM